jgi:hypothetical protein
LLGRSEAADAIITEISKNNNPIRFNMKDLYNAFQDEEFDVDANDENIAKTHNYDFPLYEPESLPVESLPVESLPVESLPVESLPVESLADFKNEMMSKISHFIDSSDEKVEMDLNKDQRKIIHELAEAFNLRHQTRNGSIIVVAKKTAILGEITARSLTRVNLIKESHIGIQSVENVAEVVSKKTPKKRGRMKKTQNTANDDISSTLPKKYNLRERKN